MSFMSGTFSSARVLYIKYTACFSWFATQFYVICATDIERNKHDTDKLSRDIACIGVLEKHPGSRTESHLEPSLRVHEIGRTYSIL